MNAASRLASGLAGLAAAALVHAQGSDELWQITSRMQVQGMQMGGLSQQVCMKKGETQAEGLGQQDPNCKVTEQRRSGNKFTWKVVCTGPEAMTGSGEMTRNRDTLDGRMVMKGKDGEMQIAYSGKLTGTCNARTHKDPQMAAAEKQMQAAQAQSNAQMAQMCNDGIRDFSTPIFEMQGSPCLARKGEYCAHVKKTADGMRTPAGHRKVMESQGARGGRWEEAARFCGVNAAPILADACKSGVSARDWPFVAEHCPTETQSLAGQHCAGREYTVAMQSEYKALCAKYAGGFAQPQRAAAKPDAPAAPSPTDAVKEGVRGLRKLFGN